MLAKSKFLPGASDVAIDFIVNVLIYGIINKAFKFLQTSGVNNFFQYMF